MLSAFIEMRDFVDRFLDSSSIGMMDYRLSDTEWAAIKDLVYVLKVC